MTQQGIIITNTDINTNFDSYIIKIYKNDECSLDFENKIFRNHFLLLYIFADIYIVNSLSFARRITLRNYLFNVIMKNIFGLKLNL